MIKHYPGYSWVDRDPEGGAAVDSRPLELVRSTSKQFRVVYDVADQCLMTAHTMVRGMSPALPTTLSRRMLGSIRTNFPRVTMMSDALEMGALGAWAPMTFRSKHSEPGGTACSMLMRTLRSQG